MCGRCSITDPREQQLRIGFVDFHETRPRPAMPRFSVAPAQTIPVVVEDAKTRRLKLMTWVSTAVNAVANNGPELAAPLREIVDPA